MQIKLVVVVVVVVVVFRAGEGMDDFLTPNSISL